MRDERERSGEESTMPAPEKRDEACRAYVHTLYGRALFSQLGLPHLLGNGIFFRQKAPYAEGGCNGFLA